MLSKTRVGRIIRQYFIHCEKQLQVLDENRLHELQSVIIPHIEVAKNRPLDVDDIIGSIKCKLEQLQVLDENRLHDTLCISDIVARFKDLTPWEASYQLHKDGYLVKRAMGTFPDPNFEHNDSIISVCDMRGNYYPRYTIKGVRMIEDYLLKKGYKLK